MTTAFPFFFGIQRVSMSRLCCDNKDVCQEEITDIAMQNGVTERPFSSTYPLFQLTTTYHLLLPRVGKVSNGFI